MRWKNRAKGLVGEFLAATFYLLAGYRIRGWRKRFGAVEADLIIERGNRLVLVEVKAGSGGSKGRVPEVMFTADKLKNLKKIMVSQLSGRQKNLEIELFVADFSKFWPKIRRYPKVFLW